MKKVLKTIGVSLLILVIAAAIFLRVRYGGGKEYPDISTTPVYDESQLTEVFAYNEPIGNVAASKDTVGAIRVFFTIHPESRPETNKLMEIVNGEAVPYPNTDKQKLFNTILGVFTDRQSRLWTIDHGNHGFDPVKLIAFDLKTNKLVHEYTFPSDITKKLSFFNDLSVSVDGRYIVVSNVSFFGKKPSLIVYDIENGKCRNLLEGHPSVSHENYVPVTPAKKMRFFGLVDLLIGIDGLDFSRDGKYVYYAGMGHSKLFRIPTSYIADFTKSEQEIANAVEEISPKPLSDGIRTDYQGNVYITDIEHQGVFVVKPDGEKFTLIKDKRIRWADGLSLGGDGMMYLADSDIPNQMLQSKKHIAKQAPYYIYKFKPIE